MNKKNFKITDKETGKEYWISRSCAVCVTVVVVDQKEDKMYLLASKRGSACPDFVGKWNLTCGYLDFDETLVEAAARELYEELGIIVKPEDLQFWGINDAIKPGDNKQNVTHRFWIALDYEDITKGLLDGSINTNTALRGGEENEVEEIRLFDAAAIDSVEWAFNHDQVIYEFIQTHTSLRGIEDKASEVAETRD
jgi:8-oxo-dGTP pyrophosphatase MutT (NUDIX family)